MKTASFFCKLQTLYYKRLFSRIRPAGGDDLADVVGYGRTAAADGDGTCFHVIQGIIAETAVRPDAVPGLGLRVVFFATVRVDDDRKVRCPFQFADEAGNVFRLRAVDTDGLQVRIVTGQLAGTIGQELAFAVVAAVAAGKADSIGGAQFFGDLRFDFRFHQGRFRFKEQDVGTGLPQEFRPAAMEVPQRIGTDAVMALIFGPIGQISPVRAGTGQTERPGRGPSTVCCSNRPRDFPKLSPWSRRGPGCPRGPKSVSMYFSFSFPFHRHRPISDDRRIFPSFLRRQETEPEIIDGRSIPASPVPAADAGRGWPGRRGCRAGP